ncbi:polyhydroxybutyrate depolymerase [Gordonia oryzae]|uniref:Polyhydroxybutyrate depolymerase n=1 Tax=Gordonia oryzae TaxID=2487349 RepID=A0A3N4GH30_9ACTN|nr:PHB depolymerase family esterase [Gordonia oryzae]RPA59956.1 polyhydroxybutyrate depolymerase [Gordonia oryzae]
MRARHWSVAIAIAVIVTASGCGQGDAVGAPPGGIPVGSSHAAIEFGGQQRSYEIYRPARLPSSAPLVVMLHGGYGDARQAERAYGWDAVADRGGVLVAYPQGVGRSWNAGSCCGPAQRRNVDDVGFVLAMVHDIERRTSIDIRRVFATGMSNGAMMALRLPCETSEFAAIAPVAGTIVTDCVGAHPTSVLQIHGTSDDRVPYGGGPGEAFNAGGTARVEGMSIPQVNALWRATDRCGPPVTVTAGSVTRSSATCAQSRAVELISVTGAGHQWPGSNTASVGAARGAPVPSTVLDATSVIWQFFTAHPA